MEFFNFLQQLSGPVGFALLPHRWFCLFFTPVSSPLLHCCFRRLNYLTISEDIRHGGTLTGWEQRPLTCNNGESALNEFWQRASSVSFDGRMLTKWRQDLRFSCDKKPIKRDKSCLVWIHYNSLLTSDCWAMVKVKELSNFWQSTSLLSCSRCD